MLMYRELATITNFLATAVIIFFTIFRPWGGALRRIEDWVQISRDQGSLEYHVQQCKKAIGDGPFPANGSAVVLDRWQASERCGLFAGDGAVLGHHCSNRGAGNRAVS